MPSVQSVLKTFIGAFGLSGSYNSTLYSPKALIAPTCPRKDLSCHTRFDGQDTCCFNHPGGQILMTQFWDADPALGPVDSWTIHGLWPDHCDGGFDQYCDSTRRYNNISLILTDLGRADLLDYMGVYWKDLRGHDPDLWGHEWNKHGTCVSTLETRCYADYIPQQEVVDYFDKAVETFQNLPSYEFLAQAGIVPSYDRTYSLGEIETALKTSHGADVTIQCQHGSLTEIWYYFNVAGQLQTGNFVATNPGGLKSNCPYSGIRYIPKTSPHHPKPVPTTSNGGSRPTDSPDVKKGYLKVSTLNQRRGCLISMGSWFSSGTCATFRVLESANDDQIHLKSSKGFCAFKAKDNGNDDPNDTAFTCEASITEPSYFQILNGKLAFKGNTIFYADKAPKGPVKSKVFASTTDHPIELEILWEDMSLVD